MKNHLQRFSSKASNWAGSTNAFLLAFVIIFVWLALGPRTGFSDTWLISIATVTDIIMFMVVFLIQNTQNRNSKALQLKLNELILNDRKARDAFIGLETLTDNELAELDTEFKELLETLQVTPAMRKLHTRVSKEKERRYSLYDQAEHLVDTLFKPINGKNKHH